jgi:threonine/homoserine/homoserine lactone efflux protein
VPEVTIADALIGFALVAALVHVLESVVWFAAIIIGAGLAQQWLSSPPVTRWIDRITGGVLVGFGALLAVESRA